MAMGHIELALPADRMARLYALAVQFGVSPEDILRISFEALLRQPESSIEQLVKEMRTVQPDIFRRLA
jgi:hypothetical protein